MRSRPFKRGVPAEANGILGSSNADGWTNGSDLPEVIYHNAIDEFKTRRIRKHRWTHRCTSFIRSLQLVFKKYYSREASAQCVAIFLFVWTILNFVRGRFPQQLISTQSNSRNLQRVMDKGNDVSPLSSGFDIVLHHKGKSRQSDFIELDRFGRHRQRSMKTRSFGELQIQFLEFENQRMRRREIHHDFKADRGFDDLSPLASDDDDHHDYYYNFDDDVKRNPLIAWNDDTIQNEKACRRNSWYRELPINCNVLHEYDMEERVIVGDTHYLSRGAYREVFMTALPDQTQVVFKSYYWGSNMRYEDYEFMRMDALITEKLASNPTIVDNYAFCALSMIGEAMVHGDMEKIAVPKKGRIKLELDPRLPLYVWNNLSGEQKLKYGLQMAETVALLHGFPQGTIIHNDLQLSQYLLDENDNIKLNDFNRGEIMFWNEKDKEYCKYKNNPGHGDWRAPEEYKDEPLDDKIDIWSLGNDLYSLLTGLYPLYLISDTNEYQKHLVKGETGFIDPRYHQRSKAESKLADIIPLCWAYDPAKRIDVFQLVALLREAYEESIKGNQTST